MRRAGCRRQHRAGAKRVMADRATPHPVPIADSYWVEPGLLLAGEYPGARDVQSARRRLEQFVHAGIRTFIDLTETTEPLSPYDTLLHELSCARAVKCRHLRYAIRDAGVPSRPLLQRILRVLDDDTSAGQPVYVHCWGGIGRTGTVIGCWLVERGMSGDQAVTRIAELRRSVPDAHMQSPETEAQRRLIMTWAQRRTSP